MKCFAFNTLHVNSTSWGELETFNIAIWIKVDVAKSTIYFSDVDVALSTNVVRIFGALFSLKILKHLGSKINEVFAFNWKRCEVKTYLWFLRLESVSLYNALISNHF